MWVKAITVVVAVAALAAPASAQHRGTLSFGAFGNRAMFDSDNNVNSGWGGGIRFGAFVGQRLSIETEIGSAKATRPAGLSDVNIENISLRLTAVALRLGQDRVNFLLGAGYTHADWQSNESDGIQGLVGAKVGLGRSAALRVDYVMDFNQHPKSTRNSALHFGLAFYRNPARIILTETVMQPRGPMPMHADSVSAYETGRLRVIESEYRELRDSLGRPIPVIVVPVSSAAALATMQTKIHFLRDESALSDSAKAVLDEKVVVFRANPEMRIAITGYASAPGTENYNMALGLRRAQAAKDYLVSRGVEPVRIEIGTRGEGNLLVEGDSYYANSQNRRGQFRLLIADPYLAAPRP